MTDLAPQRIFFHGNFESPKDWEFLGNEWHIFHLWRFLKENGEGIKDWKDFSKVLSEHLKQKFETNCFEVAGYSMGGRICLNLLAQNLLTNELHIKKATFISTHPGIQESEKTQRLWNDLKWKEKVLCLRWPLLFEEWNGQDIFQGEVLNYDAFAPLEEWRAEIAHAFDLLSLARMPNFLSELSLLPEELETHWICGEQDKKFLALAASLSTQKKLNFHIVEGAGHRIHKKKHSELLQILNVPRN